MNNNWSFLLSLFIDKRKFKSLRQIKIQLTRCKLPLSTNSIFKHKIKFRSIKSGFSFYFFERKFFTLTYIFQCSFSLFPYFISAKIMFFIISPKRKSYSISIQHMHSRIKFFYNFDYSHYFLMDLTNTTKEMSIILSNRPYTSKT